METELRRRRIELLTLGGGIIAFGVWSVLKTFLYIWFDAFNMTKGVPEESKTLVLLLSIVIIALVVMTDLALRVYIGLAARAEGLGQKRGRAYIVLTALMLAFSAVLWIVSLFLYPGQDPDTKQSLMDFIVSLGVELTSMALMVRLLSNAIRVRKLRRQLEG